MDTKVVRLHGGPNHGDHMTIPVKQNAIIVFKPKNPKGILDAYFEAGGEIEIIPTVQGRYSKVEGSTMDFEWDGWFERKS